ncbi:hypothetical protein [Streptomyces violaceusniger]|uniref:Uncharacterized protein n=1 Tax=Streptomyces violaceusniger TaxID=68280 RepID=A0A4D4LG27_STRVO|nr:hypothetical protein SVIO_088290 [Streptomyces violaceusniger]
MNGTPAYRYGAVMDRPSLFGKAAIQGINDPSAANDPPAALESAGALGALGAPDALDVLGDRAALSRKEAP